VEEDEAQDGRLESLLLYTKAAGVYEELSFRADVERSGRLEVMRAELAMHRSSAFVNARAALRSARDLLDRREFEDATKAADKALIALANYIPESDFVPSLWQLENGIDKASENRVTPDDIADASEEAWMLRGDIFAGKRTWEEALRCYDRALASAEARAPVAEQEHARSRHLLWVFGAAREHSARGARLGNRLRGCTRRAIALAQLGRVEEARSQQVRVCPRRLLALCA
jgi:tetratricopeptide (TPR) repeat protein